MCISSTTGVIVLYRRVLALCLILWLLCIVALVVGFGIAFGLAQSKSGTYYCSILTTQWRRRVGASGGIIGEGLARPEGHSMRPKGP